MKITNREASVAKIMADNCTCKNTASGNQKSHRFHIGNLTKAITLSVAFLVALPLPAQAHTGLISSSPADKTTVQTLPSEISLTFNETLMTIGDKQVSKFTLHDPKHHVMKLGALEVTGPTISAKVLDQSADAGTYKIYYRVISADGHPVSGIISFNNKTASTNNEIEVIKPVDWQELKHWTIHHNWHILETLAALGLIIAWAIYRRRKRV